ncbi:MAG: type II toxin-antitoxin system VapC family toxin [Betaproteobacteria bacterium]
MPRRTQQSRQKSALNLPTALVLDCSVALAWYLEGESTEFTDSLLQAIPRLEVWVPALWVLEFSNALFAAERRRRISRSERDQIIGQASVQPLNVDARVMSLRQTDELAGKYNLTPYDAAYFELAQRRKLPLATLDAALVKAMRQTSLQPITDLSVFPTE